ncbi:MAG: hypothetical protein QOI76_265 [Frankiales bacterium]|nr:hypothetical protein [Frankiales bacterium]
MAETALLDPAGDGPGWSARALSIDFLDSEVPQPTGLPPVSEVLLQVAALPPGAEAITLLAGLAQRPLTRDEWLSVVQAWQPQLAWAAGQESTAVAGAAGPKPVPTTDLRAFDPAALELSPAINVSQDFARHKVETARVLAPTGLLARTGAALRAGELDAHRAHILVERLAQLDPDLALAVEAKVLPGAGRGQPAVLRRRIRRAIVRLDAAAETQSWLDGVKGRRVVFDDEGADGLIGMHAWLPPVQALAIEQNLNAAAGKFDPADGRSADERRADVLTGRLIGTKPGDPSTPLTPKVTVNVIVDLPTLLGLRDSTAELVGYGPIPADIAGLLAADAQWQRWVVEAVDGHLLDQGTRCYVPKAGLERYVRARDKRCRFPGSTRSAGPAQLDHSVPYDRSGKGKGGATSARNLAALACHGHRAKTHGGFSYTQDANGVLDWTTPLGRKYRTRPHDYRGDDDPPGPRKS